VPLQTLWINFTTRSFQAIGSGTESQAEGLMPRSHANPDQAILPTGLIAGSVASFRHGRDDERSDRVGRLPLRTARRAARWAMTSFAGCEPSLSFCERDQLQSVFSLTSCLTGISLYFSCASLLRSPSRPQLDLLNRIRERCR